MTPDASLALARQVTGVVDPLSMTAHLETKLARNLTSCVTETSLHVIERTHKKKANRLDAGGIEAVGPTNKRAWL
jgi:hypothetical protein